MKKLLVFILTLICLLSLVGCNENSPTIQETETTTETETPTESPQITNITEILIEIDGRQYLILPISNTKVYVDEKHEQYLDNVDVNLLKKAEKKIIAQTSQYNEEPFFYLELKNEQLYISVEMIVKIFPPKPSEYGDAGCGIDHEHKFFSEKITK